MITIDEFKKIRIQIGEILSVEPVIGSDRLYKINVDLGNECRNLVGGLALSYQEKELVGLQVVVVTNLLPARIKNVESQGMMLGANCNDANAVTLLTVNRPVPNGTVVY